MTKLDIVAWFNSERKKFAIGDYVFFKNHPSGYVPLVSNADALAVIEEIEFELEGTKQTVIAQGAILCGVANALHGVPQDGCSHSHHDLDLLAKNAMNRIAELESKLHRIEAVANCGTVQNWLKLPDEQKAEWFAMMSSSDTIKTRHITELEAENARLRERLTLIMCEPINGEYIAQDALDHIPDATKMIDWPEDENRIDRIGQNGNTGAHYE